MENYKPNLIANEPKDGSFTAEMRDEIIKANGGYKKYRILKKKDGCRLVVGLDKGILSRSLKKPGSDLVVKRFTYFHNLCLLLNIVVDGEFYMHGEPFNIINRFFTKKDVSLETYKKSLQKSLDKDPQGFKEKYRGKDIDFLTKFHEGLKFWAFDFIITDRPDLVGFEERYQEALKRLEGVDFYKHYVVMPEIETVNSQEELEDLYQETLSEDYEGLILVHVDHEYKNGRSTLKSGTLYKMKEDKEEYDGIVLAVEESTIVKEGTEKSVNELGRSVTSKKKGDRLPSGMAKGFTVEYEGLGTFCVNLSGFSHEARKEVWENRDKYIGRHFKYTGMKPVKDFPRHAYFDCWRDEK